MSFESTVMTMAIVNALVLFAVLVCSFGLLGLVVAVRLVWQASSDLLLVHTWRMSAAGHAQWRVDRPR